MVRLLEVRENRDSAHKLDVARCVEARRISEDWSQRVERMRRQRRLRSRKRLDERRGGYHTGRDRGDAALKWRRHRMEAKRAGVKMVEVALRAEGDDWCSGAGASVQLQRCKQRHEGRGGPDSARPDVVRRVKAQATSRRRLELCEIKVECVLRADGVDQCGGHQRPINNYLLFIDANNSKK